MSPAALAILLGVLAAGPADPKEGLAKRLAAPLSPGAVALLVADAQEPAVVARLAAALRDPRSETRAAAARVATVARVRDLEQAIQEALAVETDAEAAREEIRALIALEGPPSHERLFAASDRFEKRLDPDLAKSLARQLGPAAMPDLLSARTWNLTPGEWAGAVWLAARGDGRALVPPMARALGSRDAARWDALLRLLVRKRVVAGLNVVAAAMASTSPGIAGRAAWYLVWARLYEPVEADWKPFADVAPPEGADPDTTFFFELVGRSFGRPAGDSTEWVLWLQDAKSSLADEVATGSPWFGAMTPAERTAVKDRQDRRDIHPPVVGKLPVEAPKSRAGFGLRAMSGLPRGVPGDTLGVARCRLKKGEIFGLVAVGYRPDGLPRTVQPYETSASNPCEAAALALATLALAPDEEFPIAEGDPPGSPTGTDVLFGVARPDCLGALAEADVCPSACPEDRDEIRKVGRSVEAPVLVERTEPNYSEGLRRARKEGVVVLEAIIGADGCVQDAGVLKSADPALDLEAARAVTQWKYRPAVLDGRPVRVYLTVTVTFRLNQ